MRKYYSIPLLFLFLAAIVGLFLRWQFIAPTPGIRYTYFLHAHSHLMFLGWVFNVLYLSFANHNLAGASRGRALRFFILFQPLVIAMMISFPLEGYGPFSIAFSTMHTLAALIFIPWFFRHTKSDDRVSTWFARAAWIFFFVSTAGPFSLGYLMANGLGQTVWYNLSIYYYLHFQYNGFFVFGVFSMFFQLLERKNISFSKSRVRTVGIWMAITCVPAYALSVLYTRPPVFLNILGAAAAVGQIVALGLFLRELLGVRRTLRANFTAVTYGLLRLVFFALALKLILQAASALPAVADLAYSMRPVVIAYLHLVLVGVITLFLFGWYFEMQMIKQWLGKVSIGILLVGFVGSQICLAMMPWWSQLVGGGVQSASVVFLFSILMPAGCGMFLISFVRQGSIASV